MRWSRRHRHCVDEMCRHPAWEVKPCGAFFWSALGMEGPGDAPALSFGLSSNLCTRDAFRHLLRVAFCLLKRLLGT